MEESRRVTVGLVSRHWLHHPDQLPPVMTTESQADAVTSLYMSTFDVMNMFYCSGIRHQQVFRQLTCECWQGYYTGLFTDASHRSLLTSSPTSASSIHPWWCSLQTPATSIPPACRWTAVWPRWWAPVSARSWSLFLQGKKHKTWHLHTVRHLLYCKSDTTSRWKSV